MKRLLGVELVSGQITPDDLKIEDLSTYSIQTFRLVSTSLKRKVVISRLKWKRKYTAAFFFGADAIEAVNVIHDLSRARAVDRSLFFFKKGIV